MSNRERDLFPAGRETPTPIMLTERAYRRISDLVRDSFGIHLTPGKQSLVVNRLENHVRAQGMRSYDAFLDHLEADITGRSLDVLAGLISTNYTYFFREEAHFDFLRAKALPEVERTMEASGTNDLRIWCAAASTGEEAYTIVMVMLEHFGHRYNRLDAGLLATDLSLEALRQASQGIYTEAQVSRLPREIRRRHLRPVGDGDWSVTPEVRAEVLFRKFNLTTAHYPFKKPFHIIFCRNVMIYFDQATNQRLVSALYRQTAPGGFLFIGHAETIVPDASGYRMIRPAVYQRPGPGAILGLS